MSYCIDISIQSFKLQQLLDITSGIRHTTNIAHELSSCERSVDHNCCFWIPLRTCSSCNSKHITATATWKSWVFWQLKSLQPSAGVRHTAKVPAPTLHERVVVTAIERNDIASLPLNQLSIFYVRMLSRNFWNYLCLFLSMANAWTMQNDAYLIFHLCREILIFVALHLMVVQ